MPALRAGQDDGNESRSTTTKVYGNRVVNGNGRFNRMTALRAGQDDGNGSRPTTTKVYGNREPRWRPALLRYRLPRLVRSHRLCSSREVPKLTSSPTSIRVALR